MSKEDFVKNVFNTVANRYDLMNDLMSCGLHRAWKKTLIQAMPNKEASSLLDIAGGTGDVAVQFIKNGGTSAVVADINEAMLKVGQSKLVDKGIIDIPIEWVVADGENLPFDDGQFDLCSIAFGIRNFTNIKKGLMEARRVLKSHGKFFCLEFINPQSMSNGLSKKLYELYSHYCIANIGKFVVGDREPYDYLVESIRNFPIEKDFMEMINAAGFTNISVQHMTNGVVGLYQCS